MTKRKITPKRAASETRARVKRELKETCSIAKAWFISAHEVLNSMERDMVALLEGNVAFVGKMRSREKKRAGGQ